jgi:hypothetical protein
MFGGPKASRRETLANLSITGRLRRFSDQPVAEIVQCGEPSATRLTVNTCRRQAARADFESISKRNTPTRTARERIAIASLVRRVPVRFAAAVRRQQPAWFLRLDVR